MISIENKCTLVSFADALAYQYPEKLANVNVHSPVAFVQLVLWEQTPFEKFKELNIFPETTLQYLVHGYVTNIIDQGHPYIWPILCYYMDIDVYSCTKNITLSLKEGHSKTQEEANEHYRRLLDIIPASNNRLYNIHCVNTNHAEFFPFATVRSASDTAFYAMYCTNRERDMAALVFQSDIQGNTFDMQPLAMFDADSLFEDSEIESLLASLEDI